MFMLLLWLLLMCSPQSSFTALIWHPFAAHLLLFFHSFAGVRVHLSSNAHTHRSATNYEIYCSCAWRSRRKKNTKACKVWLQSLPSVQNRKKRKRERYTKKKKERNTHQRKNWKTGNGDYIFFHFFLQNHASKWSIFDVFILLLLLLWRSMNKISACLICDRTDNM